jgi:FkbM family methyltransferase
MLKKILENFLDYFVILVHNKKILKKINIKKFNTIIDVGAHKLELFNSLKKFNYEFVSYIAFEPEKNLFERLKFKYGVEENIELHNLAIGNVNKVEKLSVNTFSTTNTFLEINPDLLKNKIKNFLSKLFKNSLNQTQHIEVEKLDNFINKIDKPVSILKINTEGYEKEVIEGAKNFILKYTPEYLIIEIQKENNYKNYNPKDIEKLIYEIGYKKFFEQVGPFNLFKDCIYILSYE